jgi:uncharacterized membrane protein
MTSMRDPASDRRLAVLAALGSLSFLFVALIVARELFGSMVYRSLTWNLFLAWVPVVFALLVYDGARRGIGRLPLVALGVLWLLFFPNAPYLVTDLKYLGWYDEAPYWYDAALLGTGAVAGLALGFTSLYLIHAVARRFWGAPAAWLGVGVVIVLGSFGIFLGRVLRWNSWDVFTDPGPLAQQLADGLANPLAHPQALAVTAVFTAFLGATYVLFYVCARLSNALGDA